MPLKVNYNNIQGLVIYENIEKPFYPLFQAKSRGFATAKLEDQDICSHITNKSAAYLPFGIQNFENLRRKGYLYVDKTNLVSQIALTSPRVFLSRPRRFGKSLVLSTLQAIFEGSYFNKVFDKFYRKKASFQG